jgi:hypothetical protein
VSTASTQHHNDANNDAREIAELLAWCRRLSVLGPDADPAEHTAYLTAKTELLTRITNPGPHPTGHGHDREEQR